MQIESFLVLSQNNDILFCTHNLKPPKTWVTYQDRLVQLLEGIDQSITFQAFPDLAIGTQLLGDLKIIVTAPSNSAFMIDSIMSKALNQFGLILKFVCNGDISQSNLMQRDRFIQLQMILQEELSPSGEMHFISETSFPDFAAF